MARGGVVVFCFPSLRGLWLQAFFSQSEETGAFFIN